MRSFIYDGNENNTTKFLGRLKFHPKVRNFLSKEKRELTRNFVHFGGPNQTISTPHYRLRNKKHQQYEIRT